MSRRNLLQGLGGVGLGLMTAGLAGAAPRRPQRPQVKPVVPLLGSAGDVVWDDELQQTFSDHVRGIYGDGYAMLYDYGQDPGYVLAYDIHAGLASYNNNYWETFELGDLHMCNGMLVAPSVDDKGNHGFAAFPAKALGLTSFATFCPTAEILSNAVDLPNGVAFVAGDGNLHSIGFYVDENQTVQSYQNWAVSLNSGSRDSAILEYGSEKRMLAFLGTQAFLFDISSSTSPTLSQQVGLSDAPIQLATSGNAWYCVLGTSTSECSLYSYPWEVKFADHLLPIPNWVYKSAAQPGKPVANGNCVYFADAGGKFSAIDAATGKYTWGTDLGGDCSQAEIYIEDGVAYLCNTAGTLFAIDLGSTDDPQVVQKALGSSAALLGVENGVCTITYVSDGTGARHLAGIDMAGQVHAFSCESTLLPDEMTGTPGSNQPSNPVYHTYVQLFDPNKNPRAFCSVKVSAYEDLTLSDGSPATIKLPNGTTVTGMATYNLTATSPVWLTTDASGGLNLTVQANDLNCPSLYLWSTFMDRDESIVIYPDHGSTQKLQGAQAAELSSAQAFDGSKMLPSNTDTAALSSALSQTLSGGVSASMAAARAVQKVRGARYAAARRQGPKRCGRRRVLAASGDPTSYIAFPASTTNLQYQYPANAEAVRPYSPSASSSFAFDIADDGSITPTVANVRGASSTPLLGLSFSDFKTKIVHGLNKIKHIESNIDADLKQAIHTITSDAGDVFALTVKTIEDAVTVVAGLLKTLASDIKKAIEWLAELFDWPAILANKDLLKGQVCSAFADFTTRINGLTSTGCKDVHAFFAGVKGDFQKAMDNATGTFQGSTIGSKQANNNDPKTVFSNGSQGPANHFHSKLKNNVHQTQMDTAAMAQVFRVGSAQVAGCAGVNLDSLKSIIEGALSNCAIALKDDLEDILTALENFGKSFQLLVTDPGAFVENAITDVLNLFTALVDTMLDAADLVVEAVLGIVASLIEGIMYVATATIHIPVISPLWNAITGDPLSFLDVVCLLAAIPYTIIEKVGLSARSSGLKSIDGQVRAWAIFSFFASAADAACDADALNDPNSPLSILDLVMDSIVFGLSYPAGENLTLLGGAYWACQCTPIAINFSNCVLFATDSEASAALNAAVPSFLNAFSCVNTPGAICMALQEPDVYMGTDGLALIPNILSNLVLAAKPGVNLGEEARLGVAVLDFALPVIGMILTLAGDS